MALEAGDEKAAVDQVDRLLVEFRDHKDISGTIYNLGKYYIRLGRVQEGLKLHRYNVEHYPYKDRYGLWSQIEIIKQGIVDGNDTKDQPAVTYQIGYLYSRQGRSDRARRFYQYCIEHWPDDAYAIASQIGLIDGQLAPNPKDEGQIGQVDRSIEALIEAISKAGLSSKDIYELGMRYRDRWPQQARLIHRYNAEHSNKADKYTLWSAVELVKSFIRAGELDKAQAAIDTLAHDYANRSSLPVELCKLANTFLESVATDPLNQAKAQYPDKAAGLYQYAQGHMDQSDPNQLWAKQGLVRLDLMKGKDVQGAIEALKADYKDSPDLPAAVYEIAVQFYMSALLA
ncbi:MAG: hypothetical protein QHH07_03015 [Sedimentisphaerales bacterium]|nr:hypothetical protein [Sedimentisphaerales bacterium]